MLHFFNRSTRRLRFFFCLFFVSMGPHSVVAKTVTQALQDVESLPENTCRKYAPPFQEKAAAEFDQWVASTLGKDDNPSLEYYQNTRSAFKQIQKRNKKHNSHERPLPQWIQTMLGNLQSHRFKTEKGTVHYLKGGYGPKVLVFFHGNPTWSFIWRKIIAQLDPSEYTFIAPDLFNLGFSDNLEKPGNKPDLENPLEFNMKNISEGMDEFIKGLSLQLEDESGLNLSKNPDVTLVVQDWGGPIGFSTAVRNPSFYKKMVILNTGVGIPETLPEFQEKAHKNIATRVQNWNIGGRMAYLLDRVSKWHPRLSQVAEMDPPFVTRLGNVQTDRFSIWDVVSRGYEYPAYLSNNLDMAVHYARMVPARLTDKEKALQSVELFEANSQFLREFNGPVHVVWGVKDDILGPELEKTVVGILPNATYHKVVAGHFLQEECPLEIAEVINQIQDQ